MDDDEWSGTGFGTRSVKGAPLVIAYTYNVCDSVVRNLRMSIQVIYVRILLCSLTQKMKLKAIP